MKRMIIAGLLAAAPLSAQAGFGVTGYLGSVELSSKYTYQSPAHQYPSIDYKSGPLVVQVDALSLFESVFRDDDIHLGVNVYQTTIKKKVTSEFGGVVQFGGSLDYDQAGSDLSFITLLAGMRMGAQAQKGMGMGIYVVPEVGINVANGDAADAFREDSMEFAFGGQVQISTWLAK